MSPSANTARDIMPRASQVSPTNTAKKIAEVVGRSFLAVLFLLSGLRKIGAYAATAAYISSVGVSGVLLPVVIAIEVLGAIAMILGWQTRVTALVLAGYVLLTALVFHITVTSPIRSR